MKIKRKYNPRSLNAGRYLITVERIGIASPTIVTKFDNTVSGRHEMYEAVKLLTVLFCKLSEEQICSKAAVLGEINRVYLSDVGHNIDIYKHITHFATDIKSVKFEFQEQFYAHNKESVTVSWKHSKYKHQNHKLFVLNCPYG